VVQVDTLENPGLAARFGVRGIPAMMMLRGGKIVDQLAGARSAEAVVAWFRRKG
jgi:thioredoxin 2